MATKSRAVTRAYANRDDVSPSDGLNLFTKEGKINKQVADKLEDDPNSLVFRVVKDNLFVDDEKPSHIYDEEGERLVSWKDAHKGGEFDWGGDDEGFVLQNDTVILSSVETDDRATTGDVLTLSEYTPPPSVNKQVLEGFENVIQKLRGKARAVLNKSKGGILIALIVKVRYKKIVDGEYEIIDKDYWSCSEKHNIFQPNEIRNVFKKATAEVSKKVQERFLEGSAFVIDRISRIALQQFKFEPFGGSGYIQLSKEIKDKHAVINLRNDASNRYNRCIHGCGKECPHCFEHAVMCCYHYDELPADNRNKLILYNKFYTTDESGAHISDSGLDFSMLTFPVKVCQCYSPECKICQDLILFEQTNNVGVNVLYEIKDKEDSERFSVQPLRMTRLRREQDLRWRVRHTRPDEELRDNPDQIWLFYEENETTSHYCAIPNISRLINQQYSGTHKGSQCQICPYCWKVFHDRKYQVKSRSGKLVWKEAKKEDALKKHLEQRECWNMDGTNPYVKMPEDTTLKFKNYHRKFDAPFFLVADFEASLIPVTEDQGDKRTEKLNEHKANSYFIYVICSEPSVIIPHELHKIYRVADDEENLMAQFFTDLHHIQEELTKLIKYTATPSVESLSKEEQNHFMSSKTCHICDRPLTEMSPYARKPDAEKKKKKSKAQGAGVHPLGQKGYNVHLDHCHLTGKYRGAAHANCNMRVRQTTSRIPIFFHNLKGYDAHHIVSQLHLIQEEQKKSNESPPLPIKKDKTIKAEGQMAKGEQLPSAKKGETTMKTSRVDVVAQNSEKYVYFRLGNFVFLDSLSFMNSSLSSLADNLALAKVPWSAVRGLRGDSILDVLYNEKTGVGMKTKGGLPVEMNAEEHYTYYLEQYPRANSKYCRQSGHFQHLVNYYEKAFEMTDEMWDYVFGKGYYPYNYVTSVAVFEQGLPPRKAFKDPLRQGLEQFQSEFERENMYEVVKGAYKAFKCRNFGDYHTFYLKQDVLLLADIMVNFRRVMKQNYKLDCIQEYPTLPGFAWDAALLLAERGITNTPDDPDPVKYTLNLLEEEEQYTFCEKGIRGGLSFIGTKLATADNPYTREDSSGSDEPCGKDKYILYLDANNLYGFSQCQPLPCEDFRWAEQEEVDEMNAKLKDLEPQDFLKHYFGEHQAVDFPLKEDFKNDKRTGYILEVDMEVPKELHDLMNSYPLAPEPIEVPTEWLSSYQEAYLNEGVAHPKGKALIPHLRPKKNYVIHGRNLQFYLEHGIKVTRIHRYLTFTERPWLRPFIMLNTKLRAHATNEFEKGLFKLMSNSVFGKQMESVRDRYDFKFRSTVKQMKNAARNPLLKLPMIYYNKDLCLAQFYPKQVCLNKPIFSGLTILDNSKLLMYQFFYDFLVPTFGSENVRLNFTDTDSFCLTIHSDTDVYDVIHENGKKWFDLSNISPSFRTKSGKQLYDPTNKKQPGYFKLETAERAPLQFCGLRAKMYSLLVDDEHHFLGKHDPDVGLPPQVKAAKGTPRAYHALLNHSLYVQSLGYLKGKHLQRPSVGYVPQLADEPVFISSSGDIQEKPDEDSIMIPPAVSRDMDVAALRSMKHQVFTLRQQRKVLSSYDYKTYIEGFEESLRHGHYKTPSYVPIDE